MLLKNFLNDFEMVPVAPIVTGITFVLQSTYYYYYYYYYYYNYYYLYLYYRLLSQAFFPGTSLEPAVIPTAQASSFTMQYFPYYM